MSQFNRSFDVGQQVMSRRRLLQMGALGLGGAVLLGACGSDDDNAASSSDASSGSSSSGPAGSTLPGTTMAASGPKYGGRLRAGIAHGGPTDTLDPARGATAADAMRVAALFEGLTYITNDLGYDMLLAESIEPNTDGTEWIARLRQGVVFHDGKPLTVEDVIYTFNRVQEVSLLGREAMAAVDFTNLKKLDEMTLSIPLLMPRADFPSDLASVRIVQDGTTDADLAAPIGTGPFSFSSFTAGQSSLFVKNANYWQNGKPYLDELEFTTIADGTARMNALLGKQVDCVDQLLFTQAKQYANDDSIVLNFSEPGTWMPITMRCDTPPFDDVRVRQAMRLIADRQQLVDNAQLGYGTIANDLPAKGLQFYNDQLPQREQDLEQAKSLLKAAGAEGLKITLDATSASPGMLESATLFAEQAKGAGVEITINNIPPGDFFGPNYLQYTFSQSIWTPGTVSGLMQSSVGPDAFFNETHFSNETFNDLFTQSQATVDDATRSELLFECQKILYDEGGYIVWGLSPFIDGLSPQVRDIGTTPTNPLGGGDFTDVWLDS